MEWDIDGYEVLYFIVAPLYFFLAAVVLRTRPDRMQNRWLAAVLVHEGLLATGSAFMTATTDPRLSYWIAFTWIGVNTLLYPIWLGFISTLDSRVGRALRRPLVRVATWLPALFGLTLLAVRRDLLVAPIDLTAADPWSTTWGPLFGIYHPIFFLTLILGLLAALGYWRSSPPGTFARVQGAMFALAFGLHDVGFFVVIGGFIVANAMGSNGNAFVLGATYYGLPFVQATFLALLAYGILRFQLFDVDLKIKWTLGRGAALAGLTGTFLLITETIEFFLPGEGLLANLVGASTVAILIRPAWGLGTRLANSILPGVVETEEFRRRRRLEIYRAALEPVAVDGIITDRERQILENMRTKLEISFDEAQLIERAVLAGDAQAPRATTFEPAAA